MLFSWPISWIMSLFTNDNITSNFWDALLFNYITWSSILFPLYYFLMLFIGYKFNSSTTPPIVKVLITFIPFLSAAPYATLLFVAFSIVAAFHSV